MSYEEFYTENKKKVYIYALRKLSNVEQAEDITAESFFRLYKHWEKVSNRGGNGPILAWTYTVARNLIIDTYKKKKTESLEEEPPSDYESLMSQVIKDESARAVHNALAKLDDDKRDILEMKFGQELKFKEISEALG